MKPEISEIAKAFHGSDAERDVVVVQSYCYTELV